MKINKEVSSKKIETRGRKPIKQSEKQIFQVATRLTKKEYFAWKIWVQNKNLSEAEAIRLFIQEKIKELSFDDLVKTVELKIKEEKE